MGSKVDPCNFKGLFEDSDLVCKVGVSPGFRSGVRVRVSVCVKTERRADRGHISGMKLFLSLFVLPDTG